MKTWLLAGTMVVLAASAHAQVKPSLSLPLWNQMRSNPLGLKSMEIPHVAKKPTGLRASQAGPWEKLTLPPSMGNVAPGNPLLLHDGTVIVHNSGGIADHSNSSWQEWWKLTPDINGSYANGTWSQIASLPAGYGPLYFASATLPDGRVIVEGGEYNFGSAVWTNLGAIYDPRANNWTSVAPPTGWDNVGDAQSVVLRDGHFMLANAITADQAILDATTLTWTPTGSGKFDVNDEEGWTLLRSNKVLTVDAYVNTMACGTNTEAYDPASGTWSSAGSLPFILADCGGGTFEMGPQPLRYDNKVVAFGALTASFPDRTAIYDGTSWVAGPNIPNGDTLADAPASVLPSGNILFAAGPGFANLPTRFYEMDQANNIVQVADNDDSSQTSDFEWNFLLLPSGQVLATDFNNVFIYTPQGAPQDAWRPVVEYAPSLVVTGSQRQVFCSQCNGLTQGSFYGDDAQSATNWPLVRITSSLSGHVFYAETHGGPYNTYGIDPIGHQELFTVPTNAEPGPGTFEVVANGIASAPRPIQVVQGFQLTLSPRK